MSRPKNYTIRKNESWPAARNDSFLFHSQTFVERNDPSNLISYALFEGDKLLSKIYFHLIDNKAISLPRSPFGAFDCVENIENHELDKLLNYILNDLGNNNISSVQINSFPRCYHPVLYDKIDKAAADCGFELSIEEISQYINTQDSFEEIIQPSQRRYLNYARDNDFEFRKLEFSELNKAYELISTSREAKNYPVTMSLEQLEDTIHKFNNAYYLFGLFDRSQMIASSVCIAVNDQILYDFYHGDDLSYRKHSPIVPLISHLTRFTQSQGFEILDLGVSTENGKINKGLFNFKRNLGAKRSTKPIYQIEL